MGGYLSDAGFLRVNDGVVVTAAVIADTDRSVTGAVPSVENIDGDSCSIEA